MRRADTVGGAADDEGRACMHVHGYRDVERGFCSVAHTHVLMHSVRLPMLPTKRKKFNIISQLC